MAVSFSIYVFFYYIHFGVTYKPKWAGYYIVSIFILSLDLFVHVTTIKIYNTISNQYVMREFIMRSASRSTFKLKTEIDSIKCISLSY